MDGNLLDSDTTDTTLAKDWSLPELPEGNSSLPSASQELADIFGTSDDEDDDFPFALPTSLSMNKGFTGIGLTTNVSKSSLFNPQEDSELFLNAIPKSLGIENVQQPTSLPSILAEGGAENSDVVKEPESGSQGRTEVEEKEATKKETSDEAMDTNTSEETAKTKPVEQSTEESSEDTSESDKGQARPLRKSARLRGRYPPREEITTVSPKKEVKKEVVKEEIEEATPAAPQEPDTKVKDEPKAASPKVKSEEDTIPEPSQEVTEKTTSDGSSDEVDNKAADEADSASESSDEDSDSEEDDPEKLWCICRQPHDDRFMICCDHCEEWFHGDCVGISVGQGKRMEREGKEYICPNCIDTERMTKEQKEASRTARQLRREQMKETNLKKRLGQQHPLAISRRLSSSSGAPSSSEGGDRYGLSQLFLPDNAPKRESEAESAMEGVESGGAATVKREGAGQCVGCGKPTDLPSVYCSTQCIERHSRRSLRKLAERGITYRKTASEFVRGVGGVSVIDKVTGKMYMGISAPSEKDLVPWLMDHPSFQVLMHKKRRRVKMKQEAKKEPESPSKLPKIALMDPESVRANAKKALQQILWKRCEGAPDMSDTKQSKVEEIADDIEEKLFNLHQDISPKYKTKYRSLLFNLKDTRNQGLFRKVLLGELTPRELVRMKGEKLASEELAQWREKTIKKDIEMIKVREEEENLLSQVIRKKTYKGDVEIETPDKDEIIETIKKETDAAAAAAAAAAGAGGSNGGDDDSTPKTPAKTASTKPSKSKGQSDSKPSKGGGGGILDLLTNTTSQHGKHVFNQHCDICTGKVKAPPTSTEPISSATTTTASDDDSSHPSPDSRTAESEPVNPAESSSPDSVGMVQTNQVIWRGSISMASLTKFSTIAYPVSGPVEYLDEVLPNSLQLMGRIAHVQVWDYMDKLRSSSSRDIVVIRFECLEGETDAYMSMFNYFLRKHRCGVISSSYYGIKDMYLVPLPSYGYVAPQLLPFKGPGIPSSHPDMLLGVIVRSKTKRQPHHHRAKSKQQAVPTAIEPHAKLIGFKRHYSASEELLEPPTDTKKLKMELEVGIDITPPLSGNEEDDDSAPYEPATEWRSYQQPSSSSASSNLGGVLIHTETESEDSEGAVDGGGLKQTGGEGEESLQSVQMSFYGQHRPLESEALKAAAIQSTTAAAAAVDPDPTSISKSVAASLGATLNIPGSVGIQSILSQMSDDKLKELASVMTSLGQGQQMEDEQNVQRNTDGTESTVNTTTQPLTTTAPAVSNDSMNVSSTQQVPPPGGLPQQPPLSGGVPPGGLPQQPPLSGGVSSANPPLNDIPQGNLMQQQSYFTQPQFAVNQQELPSQSQHHYNQIPPPNQTQWAQHQNDHRYDDGMTNYNHPPPHGGQIYTHPQQPLPSQMQQHPTNPQQPAGQQQLYPPPGDPTAYPQHGTAAAASHPPQPSSQDYSSPHHHYDGHYDHHHHYNRKDRSYYDSRPYDDRYFETHDYGHGQKHGRGRGGGGGGRRPPYERYREGGRPRR